MTGKIYKFRTRSPKVIALLDRLPRGFRTPVIEVALILYTASSEGEIFLNQLASEDKTGSGPTRKRQEMNTPGKKKKQEEKKTGMVKQNSFLTKFKGDFIQ